MEVSKNIRAVRERKGFTQVDMANRMGTERSNYARLENRDINLTLKQIQEIADALEVSIYEIIGMPHEEGLKASQTDEIHQRLEERLKMTEDVLKEKRKNIKFYKTFIEWTKDKFMSQFILSALYTAKKLGIREIELTEGDEFDLAFMSSFNFTDEELKQIGDYLFSYDASDYFLNDFVASSGFITEQWYIDAYKRKKRREGEKFNFSEVKNWINGVFEFLKNE